MSVELLVDFYISDAKRFLGLDDETYQAQRDIAISLSINLLGHSSSSTFPNDTIIIRAYWEKYAALLACLELCLVLRFNLLNKPITKELEQGHRAEFEARRDFLNDLEERLQVQIDMISTKVGVSKKTALGVMFAEAPVDRTKMYDIEGQEI